MEQVILHEQLAIVYMLLMAACMLVGTVTLGAVYRPRSEMPAIIALAVVATIAYTSWASQSLVAGFIVAMVFNMTIPFIAVAISRSPRALAK